MDFDHVGEKTGEVSAFIYEVSTQRLMREMANCEVVCANCHRERTQVRLRGSRVVGQLRAQSISSNTLVK
jgi:hypothetical protein